MKNFVVALSVAFVGCTSKPPAPSVLHFSPITSSSSLIFPYGRYRHHIDLHIFHTESGQDAKFSFDGIAKTSADKIQLAVLSSFGNTLMKIDEDRASGNVTIQAFDSRLQKYQDRFGDYYAELRKMILLKKNEKPAANVTLSEVKDEIPRHIHIENKNYDLKIQVEPLDETNR